MTEQRNLFTARQHLVTRRQARRPTDRRREVMAVLSAFMPGQAKTKQGGAETKYTSMCKLSHQCDRAKVQGAGAEDGGGQESNLHDVSLMASDAPYDDGDHGDEHMTLSIRDHGGYPKSGNLGQDRTPNAFAVWLYPVENRKTI